MKRVGEGDHLWLLYLDVIMVTLTRWKLLSRSLDGEEPYALLQDQLNHNLIQFYQVFNGT
jgi:hypothetical protein